MSMSLLGELNLDEKAAQNLKEYFTRRDHEVACVLTRRLEELVRRGIRTPTDAVELLRDDRDPDLWQSAALLLEAIRAEDVADGVADALVAASDRALRACCVQVLGALGGSRAAKALLHTLGHDPDESVRAEAALRLSVLENESVPGGLIAALQHDSAANVRARAAQSLGSNQRRDVEVALLGALGDSSPLVRYWAAESLASVGSANALPDLQALLQDSTDSPDGCVKDAAAFAVEAISKRL